MPNSIANCCRPIIKPRSSGGEHSATYLYASVLAIEEVKRKHDLHRNNHRDGANAHSYDKSATEDGRITCTGRGALHNDAEDEDSRVNDDCIFARDDLTEEAGVHGARPGSEFQDRGEPTSFGCVCNIVAHVVAKRFHGEDAGKNTLVVTIKETSDASKACNAKDSKVSKKGFGPRAAGQLQTMLQRRIAELRGLASWCHG